MASTFSSILRLEKMANGEQDATWGTKLNTVIDLIEDAIAGMTTVSTTGGTTTLTASNSVADESRRAILKITGVLVSNATIEIPAKTKKYTVWNATSGAYTVTVKTSGGSGIAVSQGYIADLFCDATDMKYSMTEIQSLKLITPALGTPASGVLTNCTGLPVATGISGLGTGVATALAVNVGSDGAPVTFNGALGTPSSGMVTNLTGTASININGTVGATTPAAVSATTANLTGALTTTKVNAFLTATPVTGTASVYQLFNNSGGPSYIGQNDSTGVDLIGAAYSMTIQAASGRTVVQAITGTGAITTVSSTGLAVTGVGDFTGWITPGATAKAAIRLVSAGTYYGKIQNDAADEWSLAYGSANNDTLGTSVLKWTPSSVAVTGSLSSTTTIKAGGYTVATLPANSAGIFAYVTDQLTTAAAKGVAPTGGGAVVCYVMNTGAGWVGI